LTQAKERELKTLPYFVGDSIIRAQQIVCQEKNIILENIFLNAANSSQSILDALEAIPMN
jgi:hypothetical protein